MIKCLLGHNWHYARGRSIAQDFANTGRRSVRAICVRRFCSNCGKAQQVDYFKSTTKHNGDTFFGNPTWIDNHKT